MIRHSIPARVPSCSPWDWRNPLEWETPLLEQAFLKGLADEGWSPGDTWVDGHGTARHSIDPAVRGAIKARAAARISKAASITPGKASRYMEAWAAGASHEPCRALQRAAAKVFQKPMRPWMGFEAGVENPQEEAEEVLRATYRITQEYLAKARVRRVRLFRGLAWYEREPPGILDAIPYRSPAQVRLKSAPLCSFSLDPYIAGLFTGGEYARAPTILAVSVPAGAIVSLPMTGFGCLPEAEVVIAGGEIDATAFGVDEAADRMSEWGALAPPLDAVFPEGWTWTDSGTF